MTSDGARQCRESRSAVFSVYSLQSRCILQCERFGHWNCQRVWASQGRSQPIYTCRPGPTNFWLYLLWPLVINLNYSLLGWAKLLKSSKCWWGQCVLVRGAIFRISAWPTNSQKLAGRGSPLGRTFAKKIRLLRLGTSTRRDFTELFPTWTQTIGNVSRLWYDFEFRF